MEESSHGPGNQFLLFFTPSFSSIHVPQALNQSWYILPVPGHHITLSCHVLGFTWLWHFLWLCLLVSDDLDSFEECWTVVLCGTPLLEFDAFLMMIPVMPGLGAGRSQREVTFSSSLVKGASYQRDLSLLILTWPWPPGWSRFIPFLNCKFSLEDLLFSVLSGVPGTPQFLTCDFDYLELSRHIF